MNKNTVPALIAVGIVGYLLYKNSVLGKVSSDVNNLVEAGQKYSFNPIDALKRLFGDS